MTPRIVAHFSCGAASAVATKMAISAYLRELDPDSGRDDEPEISCSFFCAAAEESWRR